MDEKKDEEICWGPVIGILYENEKKIRDEYPQAYGTGCPLRASRSRYQSSLL